MSPPALPVPAWTDHSHRSWSMFEGSELRGRSSHRGAVFRDGGPDTPLHRSGHEQCLRELHVKSHGCGGKGGPAAAMAWTWPPAQAHWQVPAEKGQFRGLGTSQPALPPECRFQGGWPRPSPSQIWSRAVPVRGPRGVPELRREGGVRQPPWPCTGQWRGAPASLDTFTRCGRPSTLRLIE